MRGDQQKDGVVAANEKEQCEHPVLLLQSGTGLVKEGPWFMPMRKSTMNRQAGNAQWLKAGLQVVRAGTHIQL